MKKAINNRNKWYGRKTICDFLLEKGYKVYGMERHSSLKNRTNTKHLESQENFEFITGDLTDELQYFQHYQLLNQMKFTI